jgi:predicted P-loop ATPase
MSLTSDRVHYAANYIKAGYALTPLNGKRPILEGWPNTKPDKKQDPNKYKNCNYGVVLQDDDLVIDIDPRHFEKGDNALERFVKNLGIRLLSFTVQTGGGGIHVYFKKPKDFNIKRSSVNYKGIEFKSKGQQVVGAGSIHPDTKQKYKIVQRDMFKINQAPEALLKYIKDDAVFETQGLENYTDDKQSCRRFAEYLKNYAEIAIEGIEGDKTTFKTACRGRDYGLTPEKTYELMSEIWNPVCQPPWEEKALWKKIQNAYVYNTDVLGKKHPASDFDKIPTTAETIKIKWDKAPNGLLKKTISNVVNYFILETCDLKDTLAFNDFTKDIVFVKAAPWHNNINFVKYQMWTDADAVLCKYYLSAVQHFDVPTMLIHEAALIIARMYSFHPVKKYLTKLKWDGQERLDRWLIDYAGVEENRYTLTIGRKVLCAAVARVFNPGCKFDYMLVLEGRQGIYKSTLCSVLGKFWYGDFMLNTHDKDTVDAMRGKWIIEVSEMECTRRSDTQALKAFITRQCDRVRLAYARQSEDFKRQCIFIGTINPETQGYLKDTTGNRRFWPVFCAKPIEIEKLKKDVNQLWAEAVFNYELGEDLYISDRDVIKLAGNIVDERREKDPWSEQIREWVNTPDDDGLLLEVVTNKDIYSVLGISPGQYTRANQSRIANIMCLELGWSKGIYYSSKKGTSVRGYKRPIHNITEMLNF